MSNVKLSDKRPCVSCNDGYTWRMNAKSVSERVAEHRSKLKEQGLVKLELWVHPNDVTRIKKDAAAHAARRARLLKQGIVMDSLEAQEERMLKVAGRS